MAVNQEIIMSNSDRAGQLLEKVLIHQDFSGLTSIEKVTHIKNVCETLGLNPLTKPIQLIKFQNKEILYVTKDATEQLRKMHNVSLSILDTKIIDDIYIVIAQAELPDGRVDSATGAVSIVGLKGDAKANAIMKCETKAKRRATLSICGLGFMDESELDTLPNPQKIELPAVALPQELVSALNIDIFLDQIHNAKDIEELRAIFDDIKRLNWQHQESEFVMLIHAKDDKKKELLTIKQFNDEIDGIH